MSTDVAQGSPEWFAERCGKVTASRVADVIARTKTGWGASRANYMAQLVAERLTGTVAESYTNAAMQWGTDMEPEARKTYEFFTNNKVEPATFVPHRSIADTGASPDGYVGTDGLVEIKCPITATHIETLLAGSVAGKYVTQIQWQLACTGRQWCDYVSFDPRMPATMSIFIKRVPRDDAMIASLEADVTDFLNELRLTVHRLRSKYEPESVEPGELLALAG
ncbi:MULTISPECIES: lambda exonuclease family protein [unclassified Mesorhizobium]|uniref:lambda exonuclease family protein n=1 Tax=unclassified Mesorhizobium TaxID=325217 RepID=UPI000FD9F997|nr:MULTISPECIES: lambda exonuclease family protein [unclassified Mesorhizobium]TGT76749.1 exonuclease [Mesorhizobium sp. M2E.F.Ca.ET.166.01.1.1]TGW02861.1 exonuclease [Mesorhizobium sp. M2E.F.Ca.ET.154.01.1.1]